MLRPALPCTQRNTPKQHITSNLTFPIDVAVDNKQQAYVTTYNASYSAGEIVEYAAGCQSTVCCARRITRLQSAARGASCKAPHSTAKTISTFPTIRADTVRRGDGQQVRTEDTTGTNLDLPIAWAAGDAFDKKFKHLYVADAEANEVFVYAYPSGALVDTISNGLKSAFAVAVSPPGN